MPRALILIALAIGLASAACAPTTQETRIRWDQWGVPHIESTSAEGAHYGLGWAMARGRPDQLLKLMGQGRGRGAEYWGEEYFEQDALMWRLGIPQAIDGIHAAQGPDYRSRLDAFVEGVNDWFAAHPESGSEERRRALPITARDVLGHTQRSLNFSFMAGETVGELQAMLAHSDDETAATTEKPENGSNAWAIAPSRSASGNALLFANPHLPWDGFFTWFESHLTAPGLDAYGAGLLGQPFPSIMFNDHLGWTHTVNRHDGADVYAVPMVEGGYRFGDEVRVFEDSEATLRVRGPDGTLDERRVPIRRTVHGPVLGQRGDTAYAVGVAGLADPARALAFAQYDAMARATNRGEWEAALARLQLPMFNAVYADREGEILYVSNGLHPVRARGDAAFWAGVVDGGDPSLLWTEYHPYDRLLRVVDPASGFLQNANETGYTSTIPPALDPADFPADFVPPDMRARPQHSIELLLADRSISLDELIAYAHSTRLAFADNILDELIAAARADARPEAARAMEILTAWDRRTDADSRGAALFALWSFAFFAANEGQVYEQPWSFAAPTRWPDGIANDVAAVEALVAAVERMDAAGVALDLPWGELARVPDGKGGTLPSSLGIGQIGAFRVGFYSPDESGVALDFNGGTSWVAAIEFGEDIRAEAILPYGNFADPPTGVGDQHLLFSRGELRPVAFDETAIAATTIMEETLDPDRQ